MIADDLKTPKLLIDCIDDSAFHTFEKQRELLRSILEYIMPNFGEISENGKADLELNYSRLTVFVRSILHISKSTKLSKDLGKKHTVETDAQKKFEALVSYAMRLLDKCNIEVLHTQRIQDMECQFTSTNNGYSCPDEINLFSTRSLAFDRVLAPSINPNQLKNSTLMQVLRFLSILYEVNENWGVLFSKHLTSRLIGTGAFVSNYVSCSGPRQAKFFEQFVCNGVNYSFLFPYQIRQIIFCRECMQFSSCHRSVLSDIRTRDLLKLNYADDFTFNDNIRANSCEDALFAGLFSLRESPKEFLSNFSRVCQSYALDLWIGDPMDDLTGIVRVNSPSGMFPKPKTSLQQHTTLHLKAIGRVIARCIKDEKEIDFNFSKAFYKRLFAVPTASQELALSDLNDVMPHVYVFVTKLLDILNKKFEIERDELLSFEERRKAISEISFDGSSFEDLCINFTIPGFPEIEMKEGGEDIFLTIENVEEYLKLLLWHVLYKAPQIYVNAIIEGFEGMLPLNSLKIFPCEEIECLLCSKKEENWTVEYLKECFSYSEYSPAIKFMFEFLVSSPADIRGRFLQFVTLSRTLACGGLKNLKPMINISVDNDIVFPKTHTCFHLLAIPNFSFKNIAEERFLVTFRHSL